jgi:hypothetical protein
MNMLEEKKLNLEKWIEEKGKLKIQERVYFIFLFYLLVILILLLLWLRRLINVKDEDEKKVILKSLKNIRMNSKE